MDEFKQNIATDNEAWLALLDLCGDQLRDGIEEEGKTVQKQVDARTYTLTSAAQKVGVKTKTLKTACEDLDLECFVDPVGTLRFPVKTFNYWAEDPELREMIAGYERIRFRDLRVIMAVKHKTLRRMLRNEGVDPEYPIWREIRAKWDFPETYAEFRAMLDDIQEDRQTERKEARKRKRERQQHAREERRNLRKRLIDAFPKWRHSYRDEQKIYLHVGEPNSGKTHEALEALKEAGEGWYLAPLRLLAYEIYDRLNAQGIACNLLTGEEFIAVPDAMITAATIEMFNPVRSGECVVIDEAQMLADADRGWAWTRAMMESLAPEMHIIGPPTARNLIEVMSHAAEIPIEIIEHQRLAPIQVADEHVTLEALPPATILVAFSRQMVLDLKTKLEQYGRRVSVVYGSLPPEVRRRQADRFANGDTDICVATDAVGMGLNLPADVVCFFEVEKFDGKSIRSLYPSEVHQIGGRAGRFGLSKAGIITATTKRNLKLIRTLYAKEPEILTQARVAPTVDDLSLIPGNLSEQLNQWAELESIPDELKIVLRTADLNERVELAKMLTDEQVKRLGLANALQLVNAPTRKSTRPYWMLCANMILEGYQMPLPVEPPIPIESSEDLEDTEQCIASADIYLWLARRKEFGMYADEEDLVREERKRWSMAIDDALLKKLDTARRCSGCGKILPSRHRFRICDDCYYDRQGVW